MVSQTRSRARGRPRKNYTEEVDDHQPEQQQDVAPAAEQEEPADSGSLGNRPQYEESRAQRIKENTERLKSLGILDLASKLKPSASKPSASVRKPKPLPPPSRRSSRLKDMPRVSYSEKKIPKAEKPVDEEVVIVIPQGENPEVYTEEHEKLLGDSETAWTLYVDGFDDDGQRIYDAVDAKSCHQCRQKTAGLHTECSKCHTGSGQFCGDCLYLRYGENVAEVNENPEWICPGCRGICNCSRCRRDKGWAPIGPIYRKVKKLGFKSVAHYLIHTCRGQSSMELLDAENQNSAEEQLPVDDGKEESADVHSPPPLDGKGKEPVKMELDSDKEYKGGSDEDDEGNDSSESDSQ